ncbi:hypothetical protein RO21_08225 [[Actinobacillus] muris]|uniref:Phage tail collar domain-containing protein n=1 Tax=Muribacter muris TaxID=67855 RepID=A0A0J5P3M7_9PAST|nr:hypothetical protein RO21_08225 [[Actinobacillus] muris] [Muribacter muris]
MRTGSGKRLNAVEPAGLVAYFARASAPEGWLKANGAAVSRTTYAALFAAIGTTFGEGDGRTTFNLPDLRGEFIRGFRDGRNVDNGRAFGSFQGDAIRNITGNFSVRPAGDDSQSPVLIGGNSVFRQQPSTEKWLPVNLKRAGEQNLSLMTFDASRAVPTANENRPRNIALLACIKY